MWVLGISPMGPGIVLSGVERQVVHWSRQTVVVSSRDSGQKVIRQSHSPHGWTELSTTRRSSPGLMEEADTAVISWTWLARCRRSTICVLSSGSLA